ncbi:acyl-CoA carboxylase epsilon subunit [Nocardioides sp.]|uniref:acyl-CoA carboxylase epsilon subunit n=1 Tax=Nocardioides sp. TaxID=35761 RepID=UPI001A254FE8|nr:acyl-CoA carboxylase epsilon subunit [Nocardioides sp.]MBJ7359461.1 acyl-CoA carboxylase subunit epsilon [Nocardioides sp.]
MTTPGDEPAPQPFLRVVKGDPTEEELAALVAVLAAAGGSGETPRTAPPNWAAHHRKVRVTLPHGPGGWRSSALPR